MGRRSDHSRPELRALIIATGATLMDEVGYAQFSAREVAKRIGYSIGTIHNVFGNVDGLVTAINTQTFDLWANELRGALSTDEEDRIAALVAGYFKFAQGYPRRWAAIYDHRPEDFQVSPDDAPVRGQLTGIIIDEIAAFLDRPADEEIGTLARSLIATVHGHCTFALSGTWAVMGENAPEAAALARVRESLAAAQGI